MRRRTLALLLVLFACKAEQHVTSPRPAAPAKTKVVVNEAARTILYLPIYYASGSGCFDRAGLNVQIVTGGNATNAFAALLSKEADFAVADPMYVPIAREKGNQTRVVAQVVGRIAVWGVAMDPKITTLDKATLGHRTVATHPRPMTAYVYTLKAVRDAGLDPEKDVNILQVTPGSEIVPLLNHQADISLTIEPQVSKAVAGGAHFVYSYPELLGDRIFTGVMTREDYLRDHRPTALALVRCVQDALTTIHRDPNATIPVAQKYFPQLDESIIRAAIKHIVADQVVPHSVLVSEESWSKAMRARLEAGDLKTATPLSANADLDLMRTASSQ